MNEPGKTGTTPTTNMGPIIEIEIEELEKIVALSSAYASGPSFPSGPCYLVSPV